MSVWLAGTLFPGGGDWLLMCAAVLYVFEGRFGFLLYVLLFSLAIWDDAACLQPQFLALALAMPAGFAGAFGRQLFAVHLSALWCFAGLWKLLSLRFLSSWFLWDALGLPLVLPPGDLLGALPMTLNAAAALFEFALGILAFSWVGFGFGGRRVVAAIRTGALVLHIGILLLLVTLDWNRPVWSWNLFCATAAFFAFSPHRAPGPAPQLRLAVILLVGYPALYPLGLADPYGSWNLYSESTPRAQVCRKEKSAKSCHSFRPQAAPGVPLPPIPFLFLRAFRTVCRPGDTLEVHETRRFVLLWRPEPKRARCDPRSTPATPGAPALSFP